MIVLDASTLVAHADSDNVHHATAERLLLANMEQDFVTSPITAAEFLVGPTRAGASRSCAPTPG